MALTRISDVVIRGGVPVPFELGDVLTDPPPAKLTAAEAIDAQPPYSELLRNALALDDRLAGVRQDAPRALGALAKRHVTPVAR